MKKVCLIIVDGFGLAPAWGGNAIGLAKMPNWRLWWQSLPHASLVAHGQAVGLPGHEIGNSEVGHLTIGAGRVVPQDSSRINHEISTGKFFTNQVLIEAFNIAKKKNKPIHLMGLLSNGGVHASFNHLEALLKLCQMQEAKKVYLHLFMDGRDTPSELGLELLEKLQKAMDEYGCGQIATMTGRYFAMDRDHRMNRTDRAVKCLVDGIGDLSNSPRKVLSSAYALGKTDEFVSPTVLVGSDNKPVGLINDGDPVIFFNYRSDRARQIANELSDRLPHSQIITFVPYGSTEDRLKKDNVIAAFKPEPIQDGLANFLSKNNIHQLHVAESEKYAHVTYFFNSGVETANEFEDRIVIPSPKVKTYDLKPEMSAKEITKTVIKGLNGDHYQFIVVNYANADMVGHTGNLKASINALECLDACFGQVVQAAEENNWYTIITADHGNVEEMVDPITGEINPEHTRNPVPFVIIPPHDQQTGNLIKTGTLADVAPTILHIMGIKKPNVMTGHNLLADP